MYAKCQNATIFQTSFQVSDPEIQIDFNWISLDQSECIGSYQNSKSRNPDWSKMQTECNKKCMQNTRMQQFPKQVLPSSNHRLLKRLVSIVDYGVNPEFQIDPNWNSLDQSGSIWIKAAMKIRNLDVGSYQNSNPDCFRSIQSGSIWINLDLGKPTHWKPLILNYLFIDQVSSFSWYPRTIYTKLSALYTVQLVLIYPDIIQWYLHSQGLGPLAGRGNHLSLG